jgi:hypothetical protein
VPRLLNTTLNSVGPLKANSGLIQLPRLCWLSIWLCTQAAAQPQKLH